MSQVDPHIEELIHAEIDGVITAAGREELERAARGDAAVAGQRAEFRALAAALGGAGLVEPPADLAADVSRAIAATRVVPFRRAVAPARTSWARTAALLAAGIALGALGVWLVGTLARVAPAQAAGTIGAAPVASGATVATAPAARTVHVPAPAAAPAEVVVTIDGRPAAQWTQDGPGRVTIEFAAAERR